MAPPHPGAFTREEILDELGLSVSEAAKVLDVRRATLSDLINGNAALSAEMALRIEKAFGVKMETLLNMQAWHDAYAMRHILHDWSDELCVKILSNIRQVMPAAGRLLIVESVLATDTPKNWETTANPCRAYQAGCA